MLYESTVKTKSVALAEARRVRIDDEERISPSTSSHGLFAQAASIPANEELQQPILEDGAATASSRS